MPFTNELTGAGGSYTVGGSTITYTVVATGGDLGTYGAGYGDIDGTNYYIGNDSIAETYTYSFDQTVAGLQINVNAQNAAETIDFVVNGVDVNLNTLIASGDVTVIATGNGSLDGNGDLIGSDANAANGNSTIYQFNVPIDSIALVHTNTGGNGSLVEVLASDQAASDGIIEGTAGADDIDSVYAGDPHGDMVDANDNAAGNNDDVIYGYGGNDTINSGLGSDLVDGGDGDDLISGEVGDDSLSGGNDNDTIYAGDGADTVDGGTGDDYLSGGIGNDSVDGGDGFDDLDGGDGNDTLSGGADGDNMDGGVGNDSLDGGTGNDSIWGDTGDDTISGGDGDDAIYANEGTDSIDGGAGADYIQLTSGNDTVAGGDDNDNIQILAGAYADGAVVTVDGGTSGVDNDNLSLSSWTAFRNHIQTADADADSTSGSIELLDGSGNWITVNFTEIEIFYLPATDLTPDYIVEGTTGDDLIGAAYTGDPEGDRIDNNDNLAGDNDDSVDAGAGHDTVVAGAGNDSVEGGSGNDSLLGDAGDDSLFGEDGDDFLSGLADDDFLSGGAGQDTLSGGIGNDTLEGGADNDSLYGAGGEDSLSGEGGDDYLSGLTGSDTLVGGSGQDSLHGGDDADTLDGGVDNDSLFGGDGDDSLQGGEGDDYLVGQGGDDLFDYSVGDGDDIIADFNTGNTGTLDDGDNTNNDFINLSGFYDHISELYADQADDGVLNQSNTTNTRGETTNYADNDQFGSGSIRFNGASADNTSFTVENTGVVCFTEGTLIRTDRGETLIETLAVGDLVETVDRGLQPIRWIGCRKLDAIDLAAAPNLKPIRVSAGALGKGLPEQDLVLSPQHCVLVSSKIVERVFDVKEVLVPVKKLLGMKGIETVQALDNVTYYHLLFDHHEVIYGNGALSESLYLGPQAIKTFSPDGFREVVQLFPEVLEEGFNQAAARHIPKKGDTIANLVHRHNKNGHPLCAYQAETIA